jgi:hypothetical protein
VRHAPFLASLDEQVLSPIRQFRRDLDKIHQRLNEATTRRKGQITVTPEMLQEAKTAFEGRGIR